MVEKDNVNFFFFFLFIPFLLQSALTPDITIVVMFLSLDWYAQVSLFACIVFKTQKSSSVGFHYAISCWNNERVSLESFSIAFCFVKKKKKTHLPSAGLLRYSSKWNALIKDAELIKSHPYCFYKMQTKYDINSQNFIIREHVIFVLLFYDMWREREAITNDN